VEYQLDAFQGLEYLRPNQGVGVRHEPDEHPLV
jgi:hypothetical protein